MTRISQATATNAALAANLREFADLLEQQGADGFRVAAFRRAADVVEMLDEPVAQIAVTGGRDALIALPAIGRSIAAALVEMVATGRWSQLDRLRGTLEPERLLQTIPGIGPALAGRICSRLHVESLEALEVAAFDGRLEGLEGFGPRRLQMVRTALAERLGRARFVLQRQRQPPPPVWLLLEVDRAYRAAAKAGRLRRIKPKRFNPEGRTWLPVLHARRGPWELTALYSNTRRAHERGRVGDWVVIYYQTDALPEGQCTIVTERSGPMAGLRVVRGREAECAEAFTRPAEIDAAPAGSKKTVSLEH